MKNNIYLNNSKTVFLSYDSSQVKWSNEGSFLNNAHKDLKAELEEQLKEEGQLNKVIAENLSNIKLTNA